MGSEQVDVLSGKVVLFQKAQQRHRRAVPPVGIPQEHRIVLIEISHIFLKLRADIFAALLVGALQAGVPITGIGICISFSDFIIGARPFNV